MNFIKIKTSELLEANYNPRKKLKPSDKEYQEIKRSIQEFGYVQPLIVNKDNTIIGGHQRLSVLKDLGYEEIDVIKVDVNKEQEKALNIALNKVTGRWDSKLLNKLLIDLDSKKFDLSLTGFNPNVIELGIHGDARDTQKMVEGILNLEKAQYDGVGKYDIPEIYPVYDLPEIKEWIGFNYVLSDSNPEGKAVHFFLDDYQFERVWNNPDKYIEKLKKYVCVASPDFSPYGDMPLILQMYNHYRKHWVARYFQENGITVIPTIRSSTDPRSTEWYLDGEPRESIVCISSMWSTTSEEMAEAFLNEYNKMYDELNPSKVFVYGRENEQLRGNIEYIQTFGDKRWKRGKGN